MPGSLLWRGFGERLAGPSSVWSITRCMRVLVFGPILAALRQVRVTPPDASADVQQDPSLVSRYFPYAACCAQPLSPWFVYLATHLSLPFFVCLMAVWGWCLWRPFQLIPFSAFWLRSCVVSVLISLIAYMVLIEDLRLTSISRGGVVNGALAHRLTSMVAVLHYRCSRAPDPHHIRARTSVCFSQQLG